MIYVLLAWEFLQIGLFAVGGGLATVPFLYDLATKYSWFNTQELADMIAVSQSTPGPVGINMATYAGFKAAGIGGSLTATLAEVLPSMCVVYFIAKFLSVQKSGYINRVLQGIRPAVMALILFAGWNIAKETIIDCKTGIIVALLLSAMHFYKKSAIFYIVISAVIGIIFRI